MPRTSRQLSVVSYQLGLAIAVLLALTAGVAAQTDSDGLSRAHAMHETLLATPVEQRTAADYQDIIAALQPLWSDPNAAGADDARFEAAGIYVGWARDLHHEAAYGQAAQVLLSLLHASPYTAYRRNAEFALAQIQIFHLHQPSAAAIWLRDFDQRYPADPRVAIARREVRGERLTEPAYFAGPDTPAGSETPAAVAPLPTTAKAAAAEPRDLAVRAGNIRGIQVFTNTGSSSVVIALSAEVGFKRGVIAENHLAYFDVDSHGGGPAGHAHDAEFAINDGRIKSVRVASHDEGFTRVVIVATSGAIHIDRGRFFPNPARLVVGLSGGTAAAPAPAPPAHSSQLITRPATPQTQAVVQPGSLPSLTRALGLQVHRIVIDPGHGGHDSGTIGADGTQEKDVVLDVALRLARLLRQKQAMDVVLTRSDDTFIPLDQRTAIANQTHADLFVSIHVNSNPDHTMVGVETYYLDITNNAQALAVATRENAGSGQDEHSLPALVRKIAWNDKVQESRQLAADLDRKLSQASDQLALGVKSAPFVVLIGAQMPSVLAEISFLSNHGDETRLSETAYRQELAQGLYQGVVSYVQSLAGADRTSVATLH